jgi:hypothetical protein
MATVGEGGTYAEATLPTEPLVRTQYTHVPPRATGHCVQSRYRLSLFTHEPTHNVAHWKLGGRKANRGSVQTGSFPRLCMRAAAYLHSPIRLHGTETARRSFSGRVRYQWKCGLQNL